jgi:citrate/tricarballylate utilization protein
VRAADFYQVISHGTMVGVFGVVAVAVLASFVAGRMRFRGGAGLDTSTAGIVPALGDGLTLRYLHATGADCSSAEETRRPWRRWFHHLTLYGFLLCFASTTVAAIYHLVFGWRAPYALTSAPVVLGLAGGIGLLVGPPGLFALRRQRDPALGDPAQRDLDASFIALLWLTAATGLLLLAMRDGRAMPALLVVHLAIVLALFLTLPYGKFVHGVYRMMALARFAAEERR